MNETGERPHVTEAQRARARASDLRAKAENTRWWAQDEADADQKAQYLKLAAALEREAAAAEGAHSEEPAGETSEPSTSKMEETAPAIATSSNTANDDLSDLDDDELQSAAARTLSWTWQVLSVLLGTATAISIIKNGFAIDVYGLPAKILAQYVGLRDTLFAPLVWAVSYWGIVIAWWVKDIIVAYTLVGAAHARASQAITRKGWSWWEPPSYFSGLLLWPRTTGRLLREWVRAYEDRKYFKTRTYGEHPDQFRPLKEADSKFTEATEQLGDIGMQIIVISLATMAFFLWNYLSGVYGLP
jgi:hypothetical protein